MLQVYSNFQVNYLDIFEDFFVLETFDSGALFNYFSKCIENNQDLEDIDIVIQHWDILSTPKLYFFVDECHKQNMWFQK